LEARIKFIDDNLENILNFENGFLLEKAENKLLFLSFCFEFNKYFKAYKNNEEFFISHLPIQFDATCNGFQHLAFLIDDLNLSKELNLNESNWGDIPKDFYSIIGLKVQLFFYQQLIDPDVKLSEENRLSYKKLSKLDIHRTLIKKAVMTIPYNASSLSLVEYIKEEFISKSNYNNEYFEPEENSKYANNTVYFLKSEIEQKLKNPNVFSEADFQNIRKALVNAIFTDHSKLDALVKYLKCIANIANKLKIPVTWTLPSGLIVSQEYYATKKIKLKPFLYTKNLLNLTVKEKKKSNELKQKIALMPNLVHSLDAATLCLLVNNYFADKSSDEPKNFYSIHDCFVVPCNKVSNIDKLLKLAYATLYSSNHYLIEFNDNFLFNIKQFYGTNYVNYDEIKQELIINTASQNEDIKFKLPSILKILGISPNLKSKIDSSKSSYIIH
jgi:DNA-directed RNA polymerase